MLNDYVARLYLAELDDLIETEEGPGNEVLGTGRNLGEGAHENQNQSSGVLRLSVEVEGHLVRDWLQGLWPWVRRECQIIGQRERLGGGGF